MADSIAEYAAELTADANALMVGANQMASIGNTQAAAAEERHALFLRSVADRLDAMREKLEWRLAIAEAKAAICGGDFCREARAQGRNPCGACALCVKDRDAEIERLCALVESAYREGHFDRLGHDMDPVHDSTDADWRRSNARAALGSAGGPSRVQIDRLGGATTDVARLRAEIKAVKGEYNRLSAWLGMIEHSASEDANMLRQWAFKAGMGSEVDDG